MTCHAKPVSSSVPFAKTKACPERSGTTSVGADTGAGAPWGTAVNRFAAPTARVALASRRTAPTITRRGKRVAIRRAIVRESAEIRLDSSPTTGEADHRIPRFRDDDREDPWGGRRCVRQFEGSGRDDDREDPWGDWRCVGQFEWSGSVLPLECAAGKALEPGLVLRVLGRRLQLKMEVRPRRMAGRADKADLGAGGQGDAVDDAGLEEGKVAIGPHEPVVRADRDADAAAWVSGVPGVDHHRVREGIDRR